MLKKIFFALLVSTTIHLNALDSRVTYGDKNHLVSNPQKIEAIDNFFGIVKQTYKIPDVPYAVNFYYDEDALIAVIELPKGIEFSESYYPLQDLNRLHCTLIPTITQGHLFSDSENNPLSSFKIYFTAQNKNNQALVTVNVEKEIKRNFLLHSELISWNNVLYFSFDNLQIDTSSLPIFALYTDDPENHSGEISLKVVYK